jgi:arginase family enzyme
MDLVAVLPAIDPSGRTALMAASVIHETIAMLALAKKRLTR